MATPTEASAAIIRQKLLICHSLTIEITKDEQKSQSSQPDERTPILAGHTK
mgnify:FL=1